MTTVQIRLHDNTSYTINLEVYDDVTLTAMINNNQLTVVNIGGLILARNSIKSIAPVATEPTV